MSRRLRIALGLTGAVILLFSLLLLTYAAWPAAQNTVREQVLFAPTVFVPPPSP